MMLLIVIILFSTAMWIFVGVLAWRVCRAAPAVALLFLSLALLATWPLILHPASSIYSPTDHVSTDAYASMWNHFFWPALALRSGIDPHHCVLLAAPYGQWITFNFHAAPLWPLMALFMKPVRGGYTDTEIKNFREAGYAHCERCKALYVIDPYHMTEYGEHGDGLFPLCERCWRELGTPENRLPYYWNIFSGGVGDSMTTVGRSGTKTWKAIEKAVREEQ